MGTLQDDADVFKDVRSMLGRLAAKARLRFKYLGGPPWSFSRCRSEEGSKTFMEQVTWVSEMGVTQHLA